MFTVKQLNAIFFHPTIFLMFGKVVFPFFSLANGLPVQWLPPDSGWH